MDVDKFAGIVTEVAKDVEQENWQSAGKGVVGGLSEVANSEAGEALLGSYAPVVGGALGVAHELIPDDAPGEGKGRADTLVAMAPRRNLLMELARSPMGRAATLKAVHHNWVSMIARGPIGREAVRDARARTGHYGITAEDMDAAQGILNGDPLYEAAADMIYRDPSYAVLAGRITASVGAVALERIRAMRDELAREEQELTVALRQIAWQGSGCPHCGPKSSATMSALRFDS